jgi:hypothetical protein
VEPQPAQPQGEHAPGVPPSDSTTTAPLPPMPQDRRAPESSAQQQVQSTPPAQPGSDSSPAQAAANPTAPTSQGGNELASQTTPASTAQQAQSAPQPEQATPATEEQSTQLQPQSEHEWVRSAGATVRSGPSSSASQLGTLRSGMEVRVVGRQSGWVQIANSDGSQTGWVYEKLVEPVAGPNEHGAAGTEAAQPDNQSQQAKGQSGWSRCWARQPACVQPRRSLRPSYSPSPKGESFASCRASPAGCRSQTREQPKRLDCRHLPCGVGPKDQGATVGRRFDTTRFQCRVATAKSCERFAATAAVQSAGAASQPRCWTGDL